VSGRVNWRRVSPYWYLIALILLLLAGLYGYHLATAVTPNRVVLSLFGLPIYWYALCIIGGISLGGYVVAELARERATAVFQQHVPASLRRRPLSNLQLPDEIGATLTKHKLTTLGDLLFAWGLDPRRTGLNVAGQTLLLTQLQSQPAVKEEWLQNAPWRVWNPDHVWNGLIWMLLLAVIGARLYHVLTPSPSMAAFGINSPLDYFRSPMQLVNLRNGGLGIYGGLLGGLLGLFIYSRRARIPMLAWADLTVIGLALGQAIGRWGNFFNQELYGRPTELPWAVYIEPTYRLPDFAANSHFHPAFLYESLWSLLTFFLLYGLLRRYGDRLLSGELMALYLIAYAIGRTLLEQVRLDSRTLTLGPLQLEMAVATFVSLLVAVGMAGWIAYRRTRKT
jgi:phosphatidylglycerol---prolipoprotein diacylglyceryl transferase